MKSPLNYSRRQFLARAAGAASVAGCGSWLAVPASVPTAWPPPIGLFSKAYQELKLSYDESAEATAHAGLDGIDCPVRTGGQVLPERVAEDLPRYAEALRQRSLKVLLLTTAIQSPATPHAETILRTARSLGVKYYRLGYWQYGGAATRAQRLNEVRAQLKELAALNKELGVCGVMQNHSGGNLVGAKVSDLYEVVKEFDPEQIAIAFDLSHALIEIGDGWRPAFEALRSHFKVAYVKDVRRDGKFVRFGEGELGQLDFVGRLRGLGCHAPISMHTEYNWAGQGREKTKAGLIQALRGDLATLKRWLGAAQ